MDVIEATAVPGSELSQAKRKLRKALGLSARDLSSFLGFPLKSR